MKSRVLFSVSEMHAESFIPSKLKYQLMMVNVCSNHQYEGYHHYESLLKTASRHAMRIVVVTQDKHLESPVFCVKSFS